MTDRRPGAGEADPDHGPTVAGGHGPEPAGGRTARRAATRMSRPRRVVPAVIVAVVLLVASLLVAAEVISRLFDRPWNVLPVDDLADLGQRTRWNDPLAFTLAGCAIALGVLLLVAAFWPGRPGAVPVASRRDGVVMAVTTGALARIAEQAAETVDGVARARATAGPGRIRVRADSALRQPGNLDDQVHRAVTDAVSQLEPVRTPQVRVTVRRREESP